MSRRPSTNDSMRSERLTEQSKTFFRTLSDAIASNERENIDEIDQIHHCGLRVKSIGILTSFTALKLCSLHSNYLNTIQPLENCNQLIYLDVHNNQIDDLPGPSFWRRLVHLKVLYLHSNDVSRLASVQQMSHSLNLAVLTLHNTPFALQQSYRHHVANAIWSLKALDYFLVADEEVIEGANFRGRFAAMSKAYRFDIYQALSKTASFDENLSRVTTLIKKIFRLSIANSPIVIIQRHVKRWLIARRLLSAKVPNLRGESATPGSVIPVTPVAYDASPTPLNLRQLRVVEKLERSIALKTNQDATDMGSVPMRPRYRLAAIPSQRRRSPDAAGTTFPLLTKLEESYEDTWKRRVVKGQDVGAAKKEKKTVKSKKTAPPTSQTVEAAAVKNEPEVDSSGRRESNLVLKREWARDVRAAVKMIDAERRRQKSLKPIVRRSNPKLNDAIMMERMQTMTLGAVAAVDRAYHRRRVAQQRERRTKRVADERRERDESRRRTVDARRLNARRDAAQQRIALRERIVAAQNDVRERDEATRERLRVERAANSFRARARDDDAAFLREFDQQHTTIGQALIRHDVQTARNAELNAAKARTERRRLESREQRELVRKFLEHRQLAASTKGTAEKSSLNAQLLSEANESLMAARKRVEKAKSQRAAALREANALFPLRRRSPSPGNVTVASTGIVSQSIYLEFPDDEERRERRKGTPTVPFVPHHRAYQKNGAQTI